jgi:hypothetical protein
LFNGQDGPVLMRRILETLSKSRRRYRTKNRRGRDTGARYANG